MALHATDPVGRHPITPDDDGRLRLHLDVGGDTGTPLETISSPGHR
jgi:hypothetical protein